MNVVTKNIPTFLAFHPCKEKTLILNRMASIAMCERVALKHATFTLLISIGKYQNHHHAILYLFNLLSRTSFYICYFSISFLTVKFYLGVVDSGTFQSELAL